MSEHVERLKQVADLLDETQNGMAAVGVDKAVEYLTSVEKQLSAAEQRAAALRECVKLYATVNNWGMTKTGCDQWIPDTHGPDPAQAALAKVEQMKTELTPLPKGMSKGFYDFMRAGCPTTDSGEAMMLKPTPPDIKRLKEGDLE